MNNRKIFYKKQKLLPIKIFIISFAIIISVLIYYHYTNNEKFFIIDNNTSEFYFIPKNKEGVNIPNLGIQILEYNYIDKKFWSRQ